MRRWLTLLLLLISLFTACARPVELPQPERPPEAERVPAPPPLPAAESLRAAPALAVETIKSSYVFTGRGPWYQLVAQLEAGTAVEYLSSREGWLWIRTPAGQRAWLVANDARVTDQSGQNGQYKIQAGRWELASPSGVRVEVVRRATGVIRVVLTGWDSAGADPPRVAPLGDLAVAVLPAGTGSFQGALDVNDSGLARVSLTPQGLLVDLEKPSHHRVIEQRHDRVELEFRPGLDLLERTPGGVRFQVRGETRPVLRPDGDWLLIDLPGALRPAVVPAGLVVEEVGAEEGPAAQPLSSATAGIPVRMPAGGLRLKLPRPDQPFVMVQTAPGLFELKLTTPGLAGKKVVIDPGHGGEETGAVGRQGVAEKQVNLGVALKLKPLLEAAGAQVIMTRTEDRRAISEAEAAAQTSYQERVQVDLLSRSALANRLGADLYVSIHANGGPQGDGGTEVFWAVPNLNAALSRHLAGLAQAELLTALGFVDRGVKQRPFNVIRYAEAPAVLVELGFMTNPAEEAVLLSDWGQDAAARALLRAITAFFETPLR